MTFLEKYELLKKSIPVPAVEMHASINCEYVDYIERSENCYYCINAVSLIDSLFIPFGGYSSKIVDCYAVAFSEKCYESIDCNNCHSCTFIFDCNQCTDCHFSAFLNSCSDCFGCVGLTHKKYCIFNKQFTKEEYFKKVEELKMEKPEKILAKMFELKKKVPHPASQQFSSENCPYGDYVYDSKNMYWCFSSYGGENSGYTFISGLIKNCWDLCRAGGNRTKKTYMERCYEIVDSISTCYNCAHLYLSEDCTNCFYGDRIMNCTDCFGCVGLKNKKYCVLNNQLTKVQYEKALKEIKKELGWKY